MPSQDEMDKFRPAVPQNSGCDEKMRREIEGLVANLKDLQREKRRICFKKLSEGAILPKYQTSGAAGFDLCAVVNKDNPCYCDEQMVSLTEATKVEPMLYVRPGQRCIVPTGWAVAIPHGFEMQIRPRSGLAAKFGITVLNSPGTIDSDYRGEVCVILYNSTEHEPFIVKAGDRIAQAVLARVEQFAIIEALELDDTQRGTGGFGSTGV